MTRGFGTRSTWAAVGVVVVSAAAVAVTATAQPERAAVEVRSQTVAASRTQLACPESTAAKGVSNRRMPRLVLVATTSHRRRTPSRTVGPTPRSATSSINGVHAAALTRKSK